MKTTLLCGAALAILGVAAVPLFAQTQATTSTTTTNYIQTSKLIGTKVKASGGEEVGEIKDVVLDQNGCMAYTVVTTGGGGEGSRVTSSSSSKTVAVPWSVYSTTSDPRVMTVRVERERIYNAPAFEYSRINEYSTGGYINNVNSYYGVSGSVGVNGSVNGGFSGRNDGANRTEAGVNTSANPPNASPGASAASSLPTATPAASAAASATPSTTPVGTATPTPSRHTNKGDKPKSELTPASPRRHTDTMNGSADSTSESSPSKQKSSEASSEGSPSKKAHRHGTESSEPTATPKDEQQRE
jgi:sporulation protein YlmC with PRC-barrel domain